MACRGRADGTGRESATASRPIGGAQRKFEGCKPDLKENLSRISSFEPIFWGSGVWRRAHGRGRPPPPGSAGRDGLSRLARMIRRPGFFHNVLALRHASATSMISGPIPSPARVVTAWERAAATDTERRVPRARVAVGVGARTATARGAAMNIIVVCVGVLTGGWGTSLSPLGPTTQQTSHAVIVIRALARAG